MSLKDKDKDKEELSTLFIFLIIVISIILIVVTIKVFNDLVFTFSEINNIPLNSWSDIGSAYSLLGIVFTGLGFLILIITLAVTSASYRLQRNSSKSSERSIKNQQFDITFFNLLDRLQTKSLNLLYISNSSKKYHGKSALIACAGHLTTSMIDSSLGKKLKNNNNLSHIETSKKGLLDLFNIFNRLTYTQDIIEYIDNIVTIIKFIEKNLMKKVSITIFLKLQLIKLH